MGKPKGKGKGDKGGGKGGLSDRCVFAVQFTICFDHNFSEWVLIRPWVIGEKRGDVAVGALLKFVFVFLPTF